MPLTKTVFIKFNKIHNKTVDLNKVFTELSVLPNAFSSIRRDALRRVSKGKLCDERI